MQIIDIDKMTKNLYTRGMTKHEAIYYLTGMQGNAYGAVPAAANIINSSRQRVYAWPDVLTHNIECYVAGFIVLHGTPEMRERFANHSTVPAVS